MGHNFAVIVLYPDSVEVRPAAPKVIAGLESFKVGVDASQGGSVWTRVIVRNLVRVRDGSPVDTHPPQLVFDTGAGNRVQELSFSSFEKETDFCRYQVVCEGAEQSLEETFCLELLELGNGTATADRPRQGESEYAG